MGSPTDLEKQMGNPVNSVGFYFCLFFLNCLILRSLCQFRVTIKAIGPCFQSTKFKKTSTNKEFFYNLPCILTQLNPILVSLSLFPMPPLFAPISRRPNSHARVPAKFQHTKALLLYKKRIRRQKTSNQPEFCPHLLQFPLNCFRPDVPGNYFPGRDLRRARDPRYGEDAL